MPAYLLGRPALLGEPKPINWKGLGQALWDTNLNAPIRGAYNLMNTPYDVLMGDTGAAGERAVADSFDAAGGVTVGSAMVPKPSNALTMGFRVFHGSPHDFPPVRHIEMPDGTRLYQNMRELPETPAGARILQEFPLGRFDMSKIGTGEGAQAYGHGLYFAENEGIAKSYRETLAGKPKPSSFEYGGADAWENYDNLSPEVKRGIGELHARLSPYKNPASPDLIEQTRTGLINTIKNYESGAIPMDQRGYEDAKAALNLIQDGQFRVKPAETPGSMYEVNIDADPNAFLDWDKPLSEQPKNVQDALAKLDPEMYAPGGADYDPSELGQSIYQRLNNQRMPDVPTGGINGWIHVQRGNEGQPRATADLNQAGIPGIKYLDAGSRGAGDGTRNYVVFDDKLISIVKKYGIAGASAMVGYNVLQGLDKAQAATLNKADLDHKYDQFLRSGGI